MKLFLTIQKMSNRGARWTARINGIQFVFLWNDSLRCYTLPVDNVARINRLIDGMIGLHMGVPGIVVQGDDGKALTDLVGTLAEKPVPAPELPAEEPFKDVGNVKPLPSKKPDPKPVSKAAGLPRMNT